MVRSVETSPASKILAPIDGSQCSFAAASEAIQLAKKLNSEVIVIHVISIPTYAVLFRTQKKIYREASKEAEKWFNRIKAEGEREGVKITAKAVKAMMSVVGTIVHFASKNDIDLIVLGTRGKTGFREVLLGSVATGVATYAPCSVLVVR
jgi:nucleotide-binding universal stress UspA family protein